tara:strand:+ start:330 stop:521 length:192 start_codon:yes stop_codon:yes gene_type:complete
MANTEDVLMEAHKLGVLEKVFKESSKIDKSHPHMEVADRFDMALQNVKQKQHKKLKKSYAKKK